MVALHVPVTAHLLAVAVAVAVVIPAAVRSFIPDVDDPDAEREERQALRYPAWEAEYRLKVLRELAHDYQKVFLFTTVPAHKGLQRPGSEILAELIKTYSPRVALVAGGEGVRKEMLANTLVVFPGSLARGEYAVVDVQDRTVQPAKLA